MSIEGDIELDNSSQSRLHLMGRARSAARSILNRVLPADQISLMDRYGSFEVFAAESPNQTPFADTEEEVIDSTRAFLALRAVTSGSSIKDEFTDEMFTQALHLYRDPAIDHTD